MKKQYLESDNKFFTDLHFCPWRPPTDLACTAAAPRCADVVLWERIPVSKQIKQAWPPLDLLNFLTPFAPL